MSFKCKECNQYNYLNWWCKKCNSKRFQNEFNKWTKWIPYDRFKDVKQYIDRPIDKWNIVNQQWKRYGKSEVALKKFDNFVNFNDALNEMSTYLKLYIKLASIQFYGITQNPETHSHMIVLDYAADKNI
ncbi:hypothetical protein Glove_132g221 [Diversispora epigaea]|uniref:Uncharacterized protein n=1 Tax=Diversispora epigaea TaxID=1348612 RepID=A0A397J474_9GLOM|nr:hypothetical protein Glove_132g221 [Diversispora epigaea]